MVGIRTYTLEDIQGRWASPFFLLEIGSDSVRSWTKGPSGRFDRPSEGFSTKPVMEFNTDGTVCRLTDEITVHLYEKSDGKETMMVKIQGRCFPVLLTRIG